MEQIKQITSADVLAAFDRWNDGNPGPAYGAVVMYCADEISLEELVRAVLLDQELDPERWQEYADVVERAFEEWKGLTRPFVAGDSRGAA